MNQETLLTLLSGTLKITGAVLLAIFCLWFSYRLAAPFIFRVLRPFFGTFPTLIASRYLFSKKERNAINIITLVAVSGTTLVTAALIIVLSVFNGFQSLIHSRYARFDPDLKIVASQGRSFPRSDSLIEKMKLIPEVEWASPVIENKAIVTFIDKQQLITVKGLMPDYTKVKRIDKLVYEGKYNFLSEDSVPLTVLGGTVAFYLTDKYTDSRKATIWAALDSADPIKDKAGAVDSVQVRVAGYFKTSMEYDAQYILVDYQLAENLFRYHGLCTGYELKLKEGVDAQVAKEKIQALTGGKLVVQTMYDQHADLYVVMQNEKFIAYLILTLMLIITGVNIVGSLSMIILEKTRDIAILKSFGASNNMIRRAFLLEGIMVGGIGGTAGMLGAFIFGLLQENFGILRINGGESFQEIPFFPHEMHFYDFFTIFVTVFSFSVIAALYPSAKAAQSGIVSALRK